MAQRILLAACISTTAVCVTLTGLVWHHANQAGRATSESNLRLAELVAKTQSTNEDILKRLQAMGTTAQSPDWVRLSFKLVQERPDGPPASGYEVWLGKGLRGLTSEELSSYVPDEADKVIRRQSDPNGLVDFGAVRPGDWDFTFSRSCNDQHAWRCEGTINVLPGVKVEKTIICPKTSLDRAAVKLRVQWPADLAGRELGVLATFARVPVVYEPQFPWRLANHAGSEQLTRILVGPRNYQSEVGDGIELGLWRRTDSPDGSREFNSVFADVHALADSSRPERRELPLGSYALRRLVVVGPCGRADSLASGARFEVLGYTTAADNERSLAVAGSANQPLRLTSVSREQSSEEFAIENHKDPILVAPAFWQTLRGQFEVRPSQVNEWKISLPDVVVSFLREKLQARTHMGDEGKDQGLHTKISIAP